VLPELMAANAAFAVIKQTVANSGDLVKAGKAIADFVNAKDTLQKKGNKKKKSVFQDPNKSSDIEEFMALEALKAKEEELKQYMIYCGRPGLWSDWIKFQAQARVQRQKEAEERKKRIAEIIELSAIVIGVAVLALIVIVGAWFIMKVRNG
jgi:hypothetical protein